MSQTGTATCAIARETLDAYLVELVRIALAAGYTPAAFASGISDSVADTADVDTVAADLAAHLADTSNAHAASAIGENGVPALEDPATQLDGGFNRYIHVPETSAIRFGNGANCVFVAKDSGQLYFAATTETGGGPSATVILSMAENGAQTSFTGTVQAGGFKMAGINAYLANVGDAYVQLYANGVPIKIETDSYASNIEVNGDTVTIHGETGVVIEDPTLAADANLTATDVVAAVIELAGRVAALEP